VEFAFDELLSYYQSQWFVSPSTLTLNMPCHQRENDRRLRALQALLNPVTAEKLSDENERRALMQVFEAFFVDVLDVEPWVCRELFDDAYYKMSHAFIQRAKAFCSDLSDKAIYQALRNVWVIASMQIYIDADIKLTDAGFAYSMLYPLSDNYLDDPAISLQEKRDFNGRFRQKISGCPLAPISIKEAQIFGMIDLIESDFDRSHYPEVYQSLCAILDAQTLSLCQHEAKTAFDCDLLKISFYKGGTSVLADAYLVKGRLTEPEALFAYGYGIILQLADDLYDIDEDLKSCHSTMPAVQSKIGSLDLFLNKLRAFIASFLDAQTKEISSWRQRALIRLLGASIELLVQEAVQKNRRRFTRSVRKELLKSCQFSYRQLQKTQRTLSKRFSYQ